MAHFKWNRLVFKWHKNRSAGVNETMDSAVSDRMKNHMKRVVILVTSDSHSYEFSKNTAS